MSQHVYPQGDILPHVTTGDYCPCDPRVEDGIVIHNSWDGREESEPEAMRNCPKIAVYTDGDQWCALAGDDIQRGFCEFGKNPVDALQALIHGHRMPPLETKEDIWGALVDEEITTSRAAELLGLPFVEVREELQQRLRGA